MSLGTIKTDVGKMMKIMPQYFHNHPFTNLPEFILKTNTASTKATEKNAIYNATLSEKKTTIIKNNIECPFIQPRQLCLLTKTLYELQCRLQNWFVKIIIILRDISLEASPQNSFVCLGTLNPRGGKSTLA